MLRALRLALARTAKEDLSLPLSVIGARKARLGQGDLIGALPDGWLAILLQDDGDAPAALCLDPGFVTAVIQFQTIGQVLPGPAQGRRFTATDAAMIAPLVDGLFRRAGAFADTTDLAGYRFAARVPVVTDLPLSLTAEWYRRFQLTVECGEAAVQGQAVLLTPEDRMAEAATAPVAEGPSLDDSSGVVRAELVAVLCRMQLTLGQMADLAPGDLLPVPQGFDQTELVTITGAPVATCRLGQLGGMRAIRANETAAAQAAPQGFGLAADAAAPEDLPGVERGGRSDPTPEILPAPEAEADEIYAEMSPDELADEISRLTGLDGAELGVEQNTGAGLPAPV